MRLLLAIEALNLQTLRSKAPRLLSAWPKPSRRLLSSRCPPDDERRYAADVRSGLDQRTLPCCRRARHPRRRLPPAAAPEARHRRHLLFVFLLAAGALRLSPCPWVVPGPGSSGAQACSRCSRRPSSPPAHLPCAADRAALRSSLTVEGAYRRGPNLQGPNPSCRAPAPPAPAMHSAQVEVPAIFPADDWRRKARPIQPGSSYPAKEHCSHCGLWWAQGRLGQRSLQLAAQLAPPQLLQRAAASGCAVLAHAAGRAPRAPRPPPRSHCQADPCLPLPLPLLLPPAATPTI